MNDKEFGLTNSGDSVVQVPVELKDHSKDPVIADFVKDMEKQTGVPEELITKRKETLKELVAYDQEINIDAPPKRKRGRPSKKAVKVEVKPMREWYCGTCREVINDANAMKIGMGPNREAIFCGQCQKSLGIVDDEFYGKIKDLQDKNK